MKIAFSTIIALILLGTPAIAQFRNAPLVFIDESSAVDISGSGTIPELVALDKAVATALVKKKVPVTVVTDKSKAQWIIESISSESGGGRLSGLKTLIAGSDNSRKFEGIVRVVDIETSNVLFAHSVKIKTGKVQSEADSFAKSFKKYLGIIRY